MRGLHAGQGGVTLIELVIAIVVLAVGVGTLLSVLLQTTRHSADPEVTQQASAIARSYLEEVLEKAFCDPNDFSTDCPASCTSAACATCSGATIDGVTPESRPSYDDVCDYAGLADLNGARDESGAAVPGLAAFNVRVTVSDSDALNGLTGAAGRILRVEVDVTHDTLTDVHVTLGAYRANY